MSEEVKQPEDTTAVRPRRKTSEPPEESLRIATILQREQLPKVQVNGFLVSAGLKRTDKMTLAEFSRQFNAWLKQPASAAKASGRK